MSIPRWTGYDLIFFDCDSTLSTIEGIDELAKLKGKEGRVGLLTDKAMNGELDLSEVYGKRLRAIRPTRGQLKSVEERYWETLVEDALAVVQALHYIRKDVFIISGGLVDAVRGFGKRLGVSAERIRAVELEYNELSGQWWNYHEAGTQYQQTYMEYVEGPLTVSSGKPDIIRELSAQRTGRRVMIGDGSSDLATRNVVDLFIGFGGVVARDKVRAESDIFVESASLAPILPLVTGSAGLARVLGSEHEAVFRKGIALSLDGGVLFRDPEQRSAFEHIFQNTQD